MTRQIQTAEDFILNEVILTVDGINKIFNITNITTEINIYESIQSLYLTGSIVFVDDQDVVGSLNMGGTERISISISSAAPDAEPIIKKFIIQNFEEPIKTNDHTTIVTANLIEDIGFIGSIDKFSKMYVGKGERIIGQIIRDKLGKSIYNYEPQSNQFGGNRPTFTPSDQAKFQYIVPNITPIEAVSIIRKKMTTSNGLPYYALSSIVTDDIIIRDLETILKTPAFNENRPFVFSQSNTNMGAENIEYNASSINQISGQMIDDTMLLAQLGSIGSRRVVRHITTTDLTNEHFDSIDMLEGLINLGIIPNTEPELLINKNFKPNEENGLLLQNYDSRYFRSIAGSTYIEDVNNYTEESDMGAYEKQVISYVVSEHLLKNIYIINVPGFLFLTDDINRSAGGCIELRVFKSSIPESVSDISTSIDPDRSGKFVMLQKRHIFNCTDFTHTVNISCGRLSKKRID